LSTDGITVLAGENESGKTAILSALRDFNLEPGKPPKTKDILPDDDFERKPRVSVLFEPAWDEIFGQSGSDIYLAPRVETYLRSLKSIWVTRDLTDNYFYLDEEVNEAWENEVALHEADLAAETLLGPSPDDAEGESGQDPEDEETADLTSKEDFANALYSYWPVFVYFNTFDDILPSSVRFSLLRPKTLASPAPATGSAVKSAKDEAPQIVKDFLHLAGISIDRVEKIANDEKLLTNYLNKCDANITGDFLSFWRRTPGTAQSVRLHVDHSRDEAGELYLNFYIQDTSNQHPEQRSRGFLWFLSFYLRLAASRASNSTYSYVLLIDEPGSFLHARAQRDVLSLFEKRIVDRDIVIYSTHSPYLIPADRLYRLKIVIKTAQYGTRIADKLSDQELANDEFSDTLSPILMAIGIDIREQLKFVGKANILVEGLSDYLYIQAWRQMLPDALPHDAAIFPCTGASTTILLSSLFIGWDLTFVVALDNDPEGNEARKELRRDMAIPDSRIVQQKEGGAIEDLISVTDFNLVLASLDAAHKLEAGEKAGRALKRLKVSKIIAAKQFSELVATGNLSPNKVTQDAAQHYLRQLASALAYRND